MRGHPSKENRHLYYDFDHQRCLHYPLFFLKTFLFFYFIPEAIRFIINTSDSKQLVHIVFFFVIDLYNSDFVFFQEVKNMIMSNIEFSIIWRDTV